MGRTKFVIDRLQIRWLRGSPGNTADLLRELDRTLIQELSRRATGSLRAGSFHIYRIHAGSVLTRDGRLAERVAGRIGEAIGNHLASLRKEGAG